MPQWSWLWPGGLDVSSIAAAIILCIFIYWGWDACLAVGEETKDAGKTPGIAAAVLDHADPGRHLRAGRLRGAVVRRVQRRGHRPEQRGEHRRRAHHSWRAGLRGARGVAAAADRVRIGAVVHPDDHPADGARNAVDGRLRGHPQALRYRPSPLHDPGLRHHRDGCRGAVLLPGADLRQPERTRRFDRVARTGGGVLLRHHRILVRLVLPPHTVLLGPKPVHARHLPAVGRTRDDLGLCSKRYGHDQAGLRLHRIRLDRRRVRSRRRNAGTRRPTMLACFAFGTKRFFRGETLNATTEVKVPDNY